MSDCAEGVGKEREFIKSINMTVIPSYKKQDDYLYLKGITL